MFDFLSYGELGLVLVIFIIMFNARDMVKTVRFIRRQYDTMQNYYYKVKSELLSDPPTEDELKSQKETEEFYRRYGEGYNPYEHPETETSNNDPYAEIIAKDKEEEERRKAEAEKQETEGETGTLPEEEA